MRAAVVEEVASRIAMHRDYAPLTARTPLRAVKGSLFVRLIRFLMMVVFVGAFSYVSLAFIGTEIKLRAYDTMRFFLTRPNLDSGPTASKYDNRFCVVYNYTVAEGLSRYRDYEPISLAVHSTLHYSNFISEQVSTFDDFISYAVFVDHTVPYLMSSLLAYWKCNPAAREKLSIHVIFNRSPFSDDCPTALSLDTVECADFNIERFSRRPKLPTPMMVYPINVMRNAARRGAGTNLHLVADVENIFSDRFSILIRNETQKMLASQEKYALVYRAHVFHVKYFPQGHTIPNLKEWLDYATSFSKIRTDAVEYRSAKWEPQLILPGDAPYHFEDVPTRHLDHQVLIRELCRAGFSFRVLSHVFNTHSGIKSSLSPIEQAVTYAESGRVDFANRSFANYLDAKYPLTKFNCPQ